MAGPVAFLTPDWPAPAGVRAAMSLRGGGVSHGPYASLNLGQGGDDPGCVAENRRRLRQALGLRREPGWLRQVHGTGVARLDGPAPAPVEADASFTTEVGLACAVLTADCLPVLFCDERATVVAAAHAGWRGLAAGVLEATVRALPVPPESLLAWLGPAIGPRAFEVGPEVRAAFVDADPDAASCFVAHGTAAGGRFLADLFALARHRLAACGVLRVSGGGECTHSQPGRFFSFRRDGRCGRMAALVWREADAQRQSGKQ